MKVLVAALTALVLPVLAWAADRDALMDQATALGRQGRAAEGLIVVERVLAQSPADLEARILKARLLAWADRNAEAEADIARILEEFPANADALALAGSIAWYRGDAAVARSRFAAALAADPANEEARQGLAQADADPGPRWRLDAGLDVSTYDGGGRKDWQDAFLRLGHRIDADTQVHVLAQHSHRFGEIDRFLEAGIGHAFAPWLRGSAALGGTVAADFLPRRRVDLGAAARVAAPGAPSGVLDATWLTLDLRHAAYRSGDIGHVAPGVQQYLFGGRTWATGRFLMMEDERGKHPIGWEARLDWQALDRLRVFGGYADVPETSDNRTLPTTSRFLGAVVGVTEAVDVTLAASRVAQDGIPARHTLGATLSVRF